MGDSSRLALTIARNVTSATLMVMGMTAFLVGQPYGLIDVVAQLILMGIVVGLAVMAWKWGDW